MNNKGFTLIELLVVLIILTITLTTVVPNLLKMMDTTKNDTYETQKQVILDAAKEYMVTYTEDISWNNNLAEIKVETLQVKGLLRHPFSNLKGKKISPLETKVLVKRDDNNYKYFLILPGEPLPDIEPPVIVINGSNPISISVGSVYTELGATATDNVDGDISANIQISGTVNTAVAGTYTITYSVIDSSGNEATTTRTVNVSSAPPSGGGGGGH
ncbi:MAG: DUF5011 domain-containing protein [Bacilli bacterium]|nr:DUF5011 domain-containing protein [Bacilli bacterium]